MDDIPASCSAIRCVTLSSHIYVPENIARILANNISIRPRKSPIVAESIITIKVRRVASCLVGQETLRSSENTSPKNLKIENPADPDTPGPDVLRAGVLAKETLTFFLEITAAYDIPGKTSSTRYDPVYYAYSFQCYTCRPCTQCNSYRLACGLHFFLP